MKFGLPRPPLKLAVTVFATACVWLSTGAADALRSFSTPDEATRFLSSALATTNRAAFAEMFGSAAETLANPDTVQGAAELSRFALALDSTNRWVKDSDDRMTLEAGHNGWPLPIPLVRVGSGWQFDPDQGVEELLNRRIGQNELDTLSVLRAFVTAQREYATRDRDGDGVLEYAQTIASSPGSADGLFWPPDLNGEISPLGPLVAYAHAEGYRRGLGKTSTGQHPFHGYLFRILKKQGRHAPGGKYDYVINGNMIGGFAVAAWPAEYGSSGVMTFIVSHHGRVYEQDLGKNTVSRASRVKEYDPGKDWQVSRD
jgi:hypothetical protein